MAGKRVYAVKRGKNTGIFYQWEECRNAVDGYPGAEYKGFPTVQEAKSYLGVADEGENNIPPAGETSGESLLAYVDGSYDDTLKKYAFGCVLSLRMDISIRSTEMVITNSPCSTGTSRVRCWGRCMQ